MNPLSSALRRAAGASALFLIAAAAHAQAPNISTVLGAGNGDGAAARHAQFYNVFGAAFDGSGNAYVADASDGRLRKIASNGTISTVAGIGHQIAVPSCDNGTATALVLYQPLDVALDHNGHPLIVDAFANCVRRLNGDGTLTNIAGGVYGFSGDNGQAVDAGLSNPSGIAVDATGNVFIADSGANRVRKVDTLGVITTIAGSNTSDYVGDGNPATSAGLNYPTAVAVDVNGNVYIADSFHHAVRKVDGLGKISTVAGTGAQGYNGGSGGMATSAQLSNPQGVAIAPNGELYIADTGNLLVRRVDAQGKIWDVAGSTAGDGYSADGSTALGAQIGDVQNVTFDNTGHLVIVSRGRLQRVESNGTLTTLAGDAGYADGTAAAAASLRYPTMAAVDAAGNLYVADRSNSRVRRLNRDGSVDTVAGDGSGIFSGDGNAAKAAGLNQPSAVAVDAAGNLYIGEYGRIRKVDAQSGNIATLAGGAGSVCTPQGSFVNIVALVVDTHGTVYAADQGCAYVYAIDGSGHVAPFAGTGANGVGAENVPATQSALNFPSALAIDAAGNVYISEIVGQRVRKVSVGGNIATIAGTGTQGAFGDGGLATAAQFSGPQGLALDRGGNVFVSDVGNSVVRRIGTNGYIQRVAGTYSSSGYSGDGGLATNAQLGGPEGLVYDRGSLYIVENFNSRVRAADLGEIFANGFEP